MSAPVPPYEGCGEDAAPYVLGALTEEEHARFLEHLRTCASCREEVSSLQAVADALPAAAPRLSAPAPLRDRVLSTVRSEAELRNAGAAGPASVRRPLLRRRPERLPARLIVASVAATAAVVLLAVMVLGGGSGGSTKLYSAQVSAPAAKATLRVSSGRGTLQISHMPQTPPGKVYEVWVKRSGAAQPTDALFTVSADGAASVGVPGSLKGVRAVMVTAEPEGGSRVPTSAPVIVANLS